MQSKASGSNSGMSAGGAPPQQFVDAYANIMRAFGGKIPARSYAGGGGIRGYDSGGTTTTSTTAPPTDYQSAYTDILRRATAAANQPLQQYSGQIVAPTNAAQNQAYGIIGQQAQNLQGLGGVAQPYIDQGLQAFQQAQTPLWGGLQQYSPNAVAGYQNPYTQSVVDATLKQFNQNNALDQSNLTSQAVKAGAFGGDRTDVARALLANQEQQAQAPVIAGLNSQGFTQAQNEFNQQQQQQLSANEANSWLNSQAGFGISALGNQSQAAQVNGANAGLAGANALLGAGGQQQAQSQQELNVPYEQWLQQQAYPFQTTSWLSGLTTGLGGASGGTSSTTTPDPSLLSQVGGGLAGLTGIIGSTGGFGANGWLPSLGTSIGNWFGSSGGASTTADAASSILGYLGQNRGGRIDRPSANNVIPFPTKRHGGGIAGNDNHAPMLPRRAVGGIAPHVVASDSFDTTPYVGDHVDTSLGAWAGHVGQGLGMFTPTGLAAGMYGAHNGELGSVGGIVSNAVDRVLGRESSNMQQPNDPGAGDQTDWGAVADAAAQGEASYTGNDGSTAWGFRKGGIVPHRAEGGDTPFDIDYADPVALDRGANERAIKNWLSGAGGDVMKWLQSAADAQSGGVPGADAQVLNAPNPLAPPPDAGSPPAPAAGGLSPADVADRLSRMPPGPDMTQFPPQPPTARPPAPAGIAAAPGAMPPPRTDWSGIAGPPPADTAYHSDYAPPAATHRGADAAKIAPWLALAQAGFGTMAGRSPHALTNIGAGGMEGIRALQSLNKDAEQTTEHEENTAETGKYRKSTLDQDARKISDAAQEAKDRLAAETKHYADEAEHNAGQLRIQQQQVDKGYWEPVRPSVNPDGTPKQDKDGNPLGVWVDRTTGKTAERPLYDPTSTAKAGSTAALAHELMTSGVAKDMGEALQIIHDPSGRAASTVDAARERLAQSGARADSDWSSDPTATLKKWREYYGISGTPAPVARPGGGGSPAGGAGPQLLPQNRADTQVGVTYQTTKGPAKYLGNGQFGPP